MNYAQIIAVVGQILGQAEAFVAGQPITVTVPQETLPIDLTSYGVGKVTVLESGLTIKVQKTA